MKKAIIAIAALMGTAAVWAADEIVTLDLTKASTELTFDGVTGAWTGTYDDETVSIDSQCFFFVHSSMADWNTWWGFTASNSADNTRKDDTLKYQFSNMAKGGIVLNDDGTVKTDGFGAPVTSADVPYLVAFYSPYMAARPCDMVFIDGGTYEPVGVYVNLNSYPYYSIEYGDGFARAFTNGDRFTLTIHGVAPDETEKSVEVELAAYTNGNLTVNRGWKYVDLSALGAVNEIYFTLDSTDSGAYGMNTPGYFCLDKLMVKAGEQSAINSVTAKKSAIAYDRATRVVTLAESDFAIVYDAVGNKVMTADSPTFSVAPLPAGIYLVRSGNSCVKIVR